MDYESLSTIIVLVILVIIAVGWLPRRTVNGMKRVVEHREDRYSSSLHLVDASSGTRFSDERTPRSKGAIMQPVQTDTAKLSPSKVAHIRQLRRAAFRRRRILAGALLAVTLLVLVLSIALHFSALFALIPGAALVLVLALGVRASRHARAWEQEVARARRLRTRAQRDAAVASTAQRDAAVASTAQRPSAQVSETTTAADEQSDHTDATGVKTDVMEGREIRQALRRAEMEQQRAFAAREARRHERAQQEAAARAQAETASESEPQIVDTQAVQDSAEVSSAAVQPTDTPAQATQTSAADTPANTTDTGADSSAEVVVVDGAAERAQGDLTTELNQVHPAAALDAFEVAASQDLISFSLGAPRNGVEHRAAEPESLEIKSTKQVAKAVPVAEPAADSTESAESASQNVPEAVAETASEENTADATGAALMASNEMVNDTAAFHETEMASAVDAPDATSDSLGTGLEAILARRSS